MTLNQALDTGSGCGACLVPLGPGAAGPQSLDAAGAGAPAAVSPHGVSRPRRTLRPAAPPRSHPIWSTARSGNAPGREAAAFDPSAHAELPPDGLGGKRATRAAADGARGAGAQGRPLPRDFWGLRLRRPDTRVYTPPARYRATGRRRPAPPNSAACRVPTSHHAARCAGSLDGAREARDRAGAPLRWPRGALGACGNPTPATGRRPPGG